MPQLIPYGVAATIRRPLMLGGVYLTSAPTIAAGDVQLSKDGGAFANITSLPTWSNGQMVIVLSATELQAASLLVRWVDQTASKLWDDDAVAIETYGHASAQHPNIGEAVGVHGEVDDAAATTTSFIGAAGLSAGDDFYNGAALVFTSGALAGVTRPIVDYVGASRTATLSPALPSAPADNSTFIIIGRG